jgi:hypothetical protein
MWVSWWQGCLESRCVHSLSAYMEDESVWKMKVLEACLELWIMPALAGLGLGFGRQKSRRLESNSLGQTDGQTDMLSTFTTQRITIMKNQVMKNNIRVVACK